MEQLIRLPDETAGRPRTFLDVNGASQTEGPPRLLLTVEEAAERIGICRSNMFRLIRQGDVESVKVGRLRRVTPAALEDFVGRLIKESAA